MSVELLSLYLKTSLDSRQVDELVNKARASRPSPRKATPLRGKPKLNTSGKEALVTAYVEGARVSDLMKQFDLAKSTVIDHLNKANVSRRMHAMSEAQIDEAVELYESGLSLAVIGKRLGFDDQTILNRLRMRGVVMRGPHERS